MEPDLMEIMETQMKTPNTVLDDKREEKDASIKEKSQKITIKS